MECSGCGAELENDAIVCAKCGNTVRQAVADDAPSYGFAVLSFFLPLIGAILVLMWNETSPKKAMSCAKGIAICSILGTAFALVFLSANASMLRMLYRF